MIGNTRLDKLMSDSMSFRVLEMIFPRVFDHFFLRMAVTTIMRCYDMMMIWCWYYMIIWWRWWLLIQDLTNGYLRLTVWSIWSPSWRNSPIITEDTPSHTDNHDVDGHEDGHEDEHEGAKADDMFLSSTDKKISLGKVSYNGSGIECWKFLLTEASSRISVDFWQRWARQQMKET